MSKQTNRDEFLPLISTGDVARSLGISREAAHQIVVTGRLPAVQVGRTWVIARDAFEQFAKTYVKGPGRRKPAARKEMQ